MARPESLSTGETSEARALRILRDHGPSVERLVASYARNDADRKDLLQDVALAFLGALPSFRGDASEKTFLLRIAHNRALAFVAKRGAPTEDIATHEDDVVATTGKNPAMVYERRERASQLLAAVRALSVPHRQVVTLLLEGLSTKEVADVLGTSENVVSVRANRARAAMRVFLETNDGSTTKGGV